MKNNHLCSVINNIIEEMSTNIINTIGFHTCACGKNKYLLDNAPFLSECTSETEEGKEPFLGDGYYMWDYNLETAHWWGNVHYKSKYAILSYPLTLSGDTFLDLVGSRKDMEDFRALVAKVRSMPGCESFGIAKSIMMLEWLNSLRENGEVFDYKVIRAVDATKKRSNQIYSFVSARNSATNLDPRILICFKDKNDIPLHRAKVVHNAYIGD